MTYNYYTKIEEALFASSELKTALIQHNFTKADELIKSGTEVTDDLLLHYAGTGNEHHEVFKYILTQDVNLGQNSSWAMLRAAACNDFEKVKLLVEAKVEINDDVIAAFAVLNSNFEAADWVREHGGKFDNKSVIGEVVTFKFGTIQSIEYLRNLGATLDKNEYLMNSNLIELAAILDKCEIATYLAEHFPQSLDQVDINALYNNCYSPWKKMGILAENTMDIVGTTLGNMQNYVYDAMGYDHN